MKRETALNLIMIAGYHNDYRTAIRLYVGNRVSYKAYQEAMAKGRAAKRNGVPCTCFECKNTKETPQL